MGNLIKALLAPLVAFLYSVLIAHYPNFPLDGKMVLALILWFISLFYSGIQIKALHTEWKKRKMYLKHKKY